MAVEYIGVKQLAEKWGADYNLQILVRKPKAVEMMCKTIEEMYPGIGTLKFTLIYMNYLIYIL